MKRAAKGISREYYATKIRALDPSPWLAEWAYRLGIEKTWLGRFLLRLEKSSRLRRWTLTLIFCFLLSFLVFYELEFSVDLVVGEVATRDVKSPIAFERVDEVATETNRANAEKLVPPVFDYDPHAYDQLLNKVYLAFQKMREVSREVQWPKDEISLEEEIKDFLANRGQFESILGREVPPASFEWLTANHFSARIENLLIRILDIWSNEKITDFPEQAFFAGQDQVMLRVLGGRGDPKEEFTVSKSIFRDLNRFSDFTMDRVQGAARYNPDQQRNILKLARSILIPNVNFNMAETAIRRQSAKEAVMPVVIAVKKNQTIVAQGTIVQPIHLALFNEIERLKLDNRSQLSTIIIALVFFLLIFVTFSYLTRFTQRRVTVEGKDILVMGLTLLFVVTVTKIFIFITGSAFVAERGSTIPIEAFLYAAPAATGPMIVGLLMTFGEVIWIFNLVIAIVLSFVTDQNFSFFLVNIIGGTVAARAVYGYKKRNDIYWSGLQTGLANALVIGLIYLTKQTGEAGNFGFLLWVVAAGFFSGIASSLLAMMVIPLFESLFNYTTDIKLLELSNLNHPLLKEMIVKAPGTYHHSLVVGNMVEGAAEKIGANPLLAKVMSYYHDIGKIHHANYYIENQKVGNNPHDHLSPNMSKTVLISHIKDGLELGRKYNLGKPILDGILQHHGTTLISFFYNKAIENQENGSGSPSEDDFRYPGPKPQFREAALCMLADSIEAAARSLEEPTPLRLRNIVRNIIQRKFMDGQLDECNLTLRDLSEIEASFIFVLIGIYHQRIDYPRKAGGGTGELPSEPIRKLKGNGGSHLP